MSDVPRLFDAGARGDPAAQTVHDRVLTAANLITFARLAGLPLFVWLTLGVGAYGIAFGVLVVVGTTDWVDGYVARRFDQVTRLGKLLDPLIDRALLATATLTLLVAGFMPWWVVGLVVLRDIVLFGTAFAWFGGLPPIAVSRTGKFATAMLLLGVPGFLLGNMQWSGAGPALVLAWLLTGVGTVSYYLAGLQYARIARALRRSPKGVSDG